MPSEPALIIDFAVLADHALFDQQGKLSVIGIFRHVVVGGFPAMHPRTHLVLRVRGRRTEVGTHTLRIRFTDPEGHELVGGEGTGQYHFEVSVGKEEPVRVPLSAGTATPPPGLM
jgi:hypothetical protein